MNKKIALILLIFISLIAISGCDSRKTYEQSKSETVSFYNKHKKEFEHAKDTVLKKQSAENITIKNITDINYKVIDTTQKITFDYDAQGMLGGQYWGLYFSSDDTPCFYNSKELTPAETKNCYFWQEPNGNNFYATERISKNWFFYYMDYDGNMHGLNWHAK